MTVKNTTSRLLFVCPDLNKPAGGIKQIYRQVSILNELGYRAYVLHGRPGFRCDWFESGSVPVLWDREVSKLEREQINWISQLKGLAKSSLVKKTGTRDLTTEKLNRRADDIFVLPEFYGYRLQRAFADHEKVIYNQNCYYTFRGYWGKDWSPDNYPYAVSGLKAVLVASENANEYLRQLMPQNKVHRVYYGIDDSVFRYSEIRKKQIAFMPRKLREDAEQILSILKVRRSLKGWTLRPIEGMNESEVARTLSESTFFLSFNHREGFGMPPVEAMSCGCVVIGYPGQAGVEYMLPDFSFPVPQRSIIEFVRSVENALDLFDRSQDKITQMGLNASSFVREHYSMNKEKASIAQAWSKIL